MPLDYEALQSTVLSDVPVSYTERDVMRVTQRKRTRGPANLAHAGEHDYSGYDCREFRRGYAPDPASLPIDGNIPTLASISEFAGKPARGFGV